MQTNADNSKVPEGVLRGLSPSDAAKLRRAASITTTEVNGAERDTYEGNLGNGGNWNRKKPGAQIDI